MNKERYRIIHDPQARRFKLIINGIEASHVIYEVQKNTVIIVSTYTQPQYRGRSLAAHLMRAIAGFAEEKGLNIKPACSYAVRFFKKHPKYEHIIRW